ncbi:MAG: DoxX family protein [Flavobacteriaceae bacterium]|nr:DoxX family protein [Flavobacteriaceae bacterium]
MDKINTLITKMDAKNGMAYALIRIFLGIALFVRGWMILANPESIIELGVARELYMWVSLVGIAHLIGGVLLCIGFFTRLGALVQIPIVFSATFFVYAHTKLMMGGQSFELASLVLFLLCVFFVFGPGPLSVKDYVANKKA